MGKLLTKADIIAADDLKTEVVPVPEWGGDVQIKMLSLGQVEEIRGQCETEQFKGKFHYLMLVTSMVDEAGQPLFQLNELDALAKKSGAALTRCLDVCNSINAQHKADATALGNG